MIIKHLTTTRGLVLVMLGGLLFLPGCGRKQDSTRELGEANAGLRPSGSVPTQAGVPQSSVPPEGGSMGGASASLAGAGERGGDVTSGGQSLPAEREGRISDGGRAPVPPAPSTLGRGPYPRPEDVPLAPMGEKIGYSPVTKSPGYVPPNDPEADAVRTGRRKAAVVDIPFTGGESSPEDLARSILAAFRSEDFNALQALRVQPDEFAEIMWPEFPESRPYCNADVNQVWFFHDRTCHAGITLGLDLWGGQDLRLLGITYDGGRAPYTNFTLYHDVHIHVLDEHGREQVIGCARSFAERKGIWKVFAFKDREGGLAGIEGPQG